MGLHCNRHIYQQYLDPLTHNAQCKIQAGPLYYLMMCEKSRISWQIVLTLIRLLFQEQSDLGLHCLHSAIDMSTWVKVFRINPEFRILRLTFHGK